MSKRTVCCLTWLGLMALAVSNAQAQVRGGLGGGGATSGLGGGLSSGGTTSMGTFGARTLGGSGGLNARSGTMFGSGGTAAGATQQDTQAGQIQGNERFIRDNRQGQFVGADSADSTQIGSFTNALGNMLRGPTGQTGGDPNQSLNNAQTRAPYRTTLQVGFNYGTPPSSEMAGKLVNRLDRARLAPQPGSFEVQVQGRVAILRGVVTTDHARALAERLVLLEPGIGQVDNQLVVAPALPPAP